jgi:hypothetical protein
MIAAQQQQLPGGKWYRRHDGSWVAFVGEYIASVWATPRGRFGFRVSRFYAGGASEIGNSRYAPDEASAKRYCEIAAERCRQEVLELGA